MTTPSPLDAARRDAVALRDAGDLGAARDLLGRALEGARPAYGEDHPDVLATALALARLHRAAGDTPAARRLLEEALAAGERRHGDAHALMLAISYDLGDVAEELGNRHEARRNFSRVASFGPAVLGEDHWAVRAAVDYLGASAVVADGATRPITTFTPAPGPVPRLKPEPDRPRSLADLPAPPSDATAAPVPPVIPWPPHGAGPHPAGAPTGTPRPVITPPTYPAGSGQPAAAPPQSAAGWQTAGDQEFAHPTSPATGRHAGPASTENDYGRQTDAAAMPPAVAGTSWPGEPPTPAAVGWPADPSPRPTTDAAATPPTVAGTSWPGEPPTPAAGGWPADPSPRPTTDTAATPPTVAGTSWRGEPPTPGQEVAVPAQAAGGWPTTAGQEVEVPAHGWPDSPGAAAPISQAATSWPPTSTPPASAWHAVSAPPAYPRKGRTATIAAVVAAIAAVVAVVLVAVTLLTRGDPPPEQAAPTPGPTITGEPPTDLRLRDDGGAVTLTWTDPTAGTVPFIVAAGRSGEQLQLMATVNPGDTDFTANGLNARLDYCFTVLAVYGTDRYAPTNQVCTTRTSPSPR